MEKFNTFYLSGFIGEFPWEIISFVISKNGLYAAIAAEGAILSIWDIHHMHLHCKLNIPADVIEIAFSTDNALITASLSNDEVYVWTLEGEKIEVLKIPGKSSVGFFAETYVLSILKQNGQIQFWDLLPTKQLTSCWLAKDNKEELVTDSYYTFLFSSDSAQLATDLGAPDDGICIYTVDQEGAYPLIHSPRYIKKPKDVFISWMCYKPGTHQLFCISEDSILGYDTDTLQSSMSIRLEKRVPITFCFSPDQKFLAIADYSGEILIWDIKKRKVVQQFEAHSEEWETSAQFPPIMALAWLPQGDVLLSAGWMRWNYMKSILSQKEESEEKILFWSTIKLWKINT